MIYHITTQTAWRDAQDEGEYRAPSLVSEGFIHASTREQVLPVANSFYLDLPDPVVLWVDPELLQATVRMERPPSDDPQHAGLFPHIYGPINLSAVVRVTPLLKGEGLKFDGF